MTYLTLHVTLNCFITFICCSSTLFSVKDLKTDNSVDDNNVKITVEGVRSKKGKLILAIFLDDQGFRDKKPIKRVELMKTNENRYELEINLEPGVYGFSILDDENNNNAMDYNFIGKPKEGFGFSNYYHKGFSKPDFDKFKFEIIDNKMKLIDIQLRYM